MASNPAREAPGELVSPGGETLFVYGTFERGFPNEALFPPSRHLGAVLTRHPHYLVIAGPWFSPMLISDASGRVQVCGELHEISTVALSAIDVLEGVGYPVGYDRTELEVVMSSGGTRTAWTYTKPLERAGHIHDEGLHQSELDPRYVPADGRGGDWRRT